MHKLTLLLSFLFISSTLTKIHSSFSSDPSILSPHTTSPNKLSATKSGNVPLYKDDVGFYVGVDLLYDSTTKSGSVFGPNTVPMVLGLYTAQTLLVSSCLSFSSYNCTKYNCDPYPADIDVRNYFYFTSHAYWATTNLYLDYVNWGYQSASIIATSCDANTTASYGLTRYGILGMGTSHTGKSNFNASKPIFSISIADDGKSGELLFKKDLSYAQSETPITVLKASLDWVTALSGTMQIGNHTIDLDVNLAFDLGSDSIGLPLSVFNQVIDYLGLFGVKSCTTGSTYQPNCNYNGYYEDLPNITLMSDETKVIIPPRVYVRDWNGGHYYASSLYLNFKGLANNLTGPSFVTRSFENCIVMDSRFMNYYYSVFEYQGQDIGTTITLYKAGKADVNPDNGSFWKIVLIGSVVIAVVTISCCCGIALRRKRRTDYSTNGSVNVNEQQQQSSWNNYGHGHSNYSPPASHEFRRPE